MALTISLLAVDALFLTLTAVFAVESIREKEPRAPKLAAAGIVLLLASAGLIVWVPILRPPLAVGFGLAILTGLVGLIPGRGNPRALKGARGHAVEEPVRFDERDIVFARNRSLPPGSEVYRRYYERHPDKEESDAKRRERGGPIGRPGAIDGGYPPNVAMVKAGFAFPALVGPAAEMAPDPETAPARLEPAKASFIIKSYARHLGADLVGVCRVDPAWAYSHQGEIFYDNWDDWGRELPEPLPYAVVFATEMKHDLVIGAPHTPTVVESSRDYAFGAFISTILVGWFSAMGYRAVAHHNRRYDLLLVPLAVDAGLGELGRQGYLIADKFGPRVRLFAVTTDMPLAPDQPIDLGAEVFCRRCLKCAESCPSSSIPRGEKTIVDGVEKWKLDEESCFDYWGRVGTDCSVCMAVCPFSRPNRSIHKLVRWLIRRSDAARRFLPYLDNFVYGKKWRPRRVPEWVDYPKSGRATGYVSE